MRSNARQVINKLSKALSKTMKDAPKVLGLEGQRHFQDNFNSQSLEGKKWLPVKRKIPGTFEYKYPKRKYLARRTNPALVGRTRQLKNHINRTFKSGNSPTMRWEIRGLKYANVQNNGGGNIPARTFMKLTTKFQKRLRNKFDQMLRFNLR